MFTYSLRRVLAAARRARLGCTLALAISPVAAVAQSTASLSLDSLLNTPVNAASKYAQSSKEAPASITILTAQDLERRGYTRMEEVLESVRGFYNTSDRAYQYLGVRGFSRPSDYTNRVLLLIDGHTMNEQTWGAAPVGGDLPLNLSAIERIEIVRGPGSALYGTNAMFAVINIVTKTGAAIDGIIAKARVGQFGHREVGVAMGGTRGPRVSGTASMLIRRYSGADQYYAEYDAPETNNGVAQNLDWDRAVSVLGGLSIFDVKVRGGVLSRTTGIPTGFFGVAFNDPRTQRHDERAFVDIAAEHEFLGRFRASGRLYGDRYRYDGAFPDGSATSYIDEGWSNTIGAEALIAVESSSRNRLTFGTEYRKVLKASYLERSADGQVSSDDAPFNVASVFAQDEFQLNSRLSVTGGLRIENNSRHGTSAAPLLAFILTPDTATTVKLLYGEAYRAPSAAEADIQTSFYNRNPALRPERIRSIELALTRRVSQLVLLSGSIYSYVVRDLIDQAEINSDGVVEFRNLQASHGSGLELEIDARPSSRLQLGAQYAITRAHVQPRSEDGATAEDRLTNSPEQIGMASATWDIGGGFHSTLANRYESGRRAIAGLSTRASWRTDAALTLTPSRLPSSVIGVRATNLFNVYYAHPVGLAHRQQSLAQDGRRVSMHVSWRL